LSATGGPGNPVVFSGSGACTVSGTTVTYTAAGRCVIDANQAGTTDYQAAPQAQQTAISHLPVPVTTLTSSQDPSTFGQKVTFTATIAPADGGTLTFTNGSTVLCNAVTLTHAGGSTYKATCAVTTLPAGSSTITAAYPGDPRYAPSAGTLTQTVAQAPTALTASFRTAQKLLTLTATLTASGSPVSGQPITFSTGTTPLCTPDTSTKGVATCTLTAAQTLLAENDHDTILASFPGTTSYQPSSATMTPP
jgi:hypothetical protein